MSGQHDLRAYIADMSLARRSNGNLRPPRPKGAAPRRRRLTGLWPLPALSGISWPCFCSIHPIAMELRIKHICRCGELRPSKTGPEKVGKISQGV